MRQCVPVSGVSSFYAHLRHLEVRGSGNREIVNLMLNSRVAYDMKHALSCYIWPLHEEIRDVMNLFYLCNFQEVGSRLNEVAKQDFSSSSSFCFANFFRDSLRIFLECFRYGVYLWILNGLFPPFSAIHHPHFLGPSLCFAHFTLSLSPASFLSAWIGKERDTLHTMAVKWGCRLLFSIFRVRVTREHARRRGGFFILAAPAQTDGEAPYISSVELGFSEIFLLIFRTFRLLYIRMSSS